MRRMTANVARFIVAHRLKLMLACSIGFQFAPQAVTAQYDPSCSKLCGGGWAIAYATRTDCGSVDGCQVVTCYYHLEGCGYQDSHNDACGTWLSCSGSSF